MTLVAEMPKTGAKALELDLTAEESRICDFLADSVRKLKRRGLVVGVSGGIDSAVCAALAVHAVGPGRVFCLLMPERDMVDDAHERGWRLCQHLHVRYAVSPATRPAGGTRSSSARQPSR
jgi:NAD+ synthase